MKFLVYVAFLFSISIAFASSNQQKFKSHEVQQGETVYSIAKKYGITTEDIYKLNPDARSGINDSNTLILPTPDVINSEVVQVKFKKHRVRRKETLFSISLKYDVSVDDIKKYNRHLYSKPIKKGEKLQIPILPKDVIVSTDTNTNTEPESKTHTVKPKETKYGIARKYGISIAELEALNPALGENLQMGAVLRVPSVEVTESATIEDDLYGFYEVQPKEGFYRLKVKLGLSEEEIVALNPYATDGLKEGMILKIPKGISIGLDEKVNKIDLENEITNIGQKRIALMLPFQLKKVNGDSTSNSSDEIKSNRAMRIAVDFYSGVLMAANFAKDKGISVNIDVYDTEGSESKVSNIINTKNFDNVDALIGPLLRKNVEKAASQLRSSKVPVLSPLSNRDIQMSSNLFQTLPSNKMMETAMIDWLKAKSEGKNLILISDSKRAKQKQAIMASLPGVKAMVPREKGFLYDTDIRAKIVPGQDNWVILETGDPVILSNVIGLLNGMPDDFKLRLFTLDKNDNFDFDDISNMHLAKLNFTFPSVNKSYDYKAKDAFLVSYKNKYGVLPNRFAVRGFDITYDVLLRLASADDLYQASSSDYETEYVENKFRYTKKMFSGYENSALYIIKYNKDLQFEVVE